MVRVAYFEGTDPLLLSKLAAEGVETLPVANAWDGHGRYVNHLDKGEVDVVVGYFHKVMPGMLEHTQATDLLFACKNFDIPVILIVPALLHAKAEKLLGDVGPNIHLTAPEDVEVEVRKHL